MAKERSQARAKRETPKGNPAHGDIGAPAKYTKEFIDAEAEALVLWMKGPTNLFIQNFCVERGYLPQRIQEFAQCNERFAEIYKLVKVWQEGKLLNNACWNICNPGFVKFVMVNHHGYRSDNSPPESPSKNKCAFDTYTDKQAGSDG